MSTDTVDKENYPILVSACLDPFAGLRVTPRLASALGRAGSLAALMASVSVEGLPFANAQDYP